MVGGVILLWLDKKTVEKALNQVASFLKKSISSSLRTRVLVTRDVSPLEWDKYLSVIQKRNGGEELSLKGGSDIPDILLTSHHGHRFYGGGEAVPFKKKD